MAESFFAGLQSELLDRQSWPTRDSLRLAIFDYLEVFNNRQRRHSSLDYLTPVDYERREPTPTAQALVAKLVSIHSSNPTPTSARFALVLVTARMALPCVHREARAVYSFCSRARC